MVNTDPLAGSSTCSVGLGPAATPLDLPELDDAPADDDPAGDGSDDGDPDDEGPDDDEEAADAPADDEGDADASDDPGDADDDPDAANGAGDLASDQASGGDVGGDQLPPPALIVARPGSRGAGPASVALEAFAEEGGTRSTLPEVFPGSDVREPLEPSDELAAVRVQWRDNPVVASRQWRLEDIDELPEASVAGGCARASAEPHIIPGMSTEGGHEARLRLSNPFDSAASVAVAFVSPTGREEPVALRNLSVPPRSVREVAVNETLPERDDLAAVVEVISGRIAVEGLQLAREAIGGVDGASLLTATTEPAETWTIPWVADRDGTGQDAAEDGDEEAEEGTLDEDEAEGEGTDGAGTSSWLWILNPEDRTAAVELTFHGPEGGHVPEGLAEVSVGPGELRRIDLSGTFDADLDRAGITARSNGVPIVVSGAVRVDAEEPQRTGLAIQLGVAADDSWVVSGDRLEGREESLELINPGSSTAVVDVGLFNGVAALRPDDLQQLEVPAGSSRTIDLLDHLETADHWSAFVTASEGELVLGRVGRDADGPLHLTAVPGSSSAGWAPHHSGLTPLYAEDLSRQLRTRSGLDAEPPDPDDDDAEPGGDLPGFGDTDDEDPAAPEDEDGNGA
ncbi:MAG: DUF5719 family protein [Nitriliruptoraceae bacterium]